MNSHFEAQRRMIPAVSFAAHLTSSTAQKDGCLRLGDFVLIPDLRQDACVLRAQTGPYASFLAGVIPILHGACPLNVRER